MLRNSTPRFVRRSVRRFGAQNHLHHYLKQKQQPCIIAHRCTTHSNTSPLPLDVQVNFPLWNVLS